MTNATTETPYFSRHSLERLQEHYPNIGMRGAKEVYARASAKRNEDIVDILRRTGLKGDNAYLLSDDRRGVFVLDVADNMVVTYLRLDERQQAQARERFDGGKTKRRNSMCSLGEMLAARL